MRAPSVDKNGMKKGAWSEEEDNKLRAYVLRYGHWNWRLLPQFAGLARCGKSCRLRWLNYLKPGVRRGNYTKEEEDLIAKLHDEFGNKWSVIAAKLPGRTDNDIKNHWHTNLKKRTKTNTGENSSQKSCKNSRGTPLSCSRDRVSSSEDQKLMRTQKDSEPCDHVHILESSGSTNSLNHGRLLSCDSEDNVSSSSGSVQELERMTHLLSEEACLAETYERSRALELFEDDGNYETVNNSSDSFVGYDGSFWNEPFLVDMSSTTASYSQDHSFSVPLDDEEAVGMFSGYLFT